jgi:organic hydroperoxide reductase OsmC/OhrA
VSETKVKVKSKQFIYETRLRWTGGRDGLLISEDKLPIEISTPPEFKGRPGLWSQVHFFLYFSSRTRRNISGFSF